MKKLAGVGVLLLLVAVAAYPQLSFKISGGMTFVNGNDFNKGMKGYMAEIMDNYDDVVGEFGPLSSAISFQAEMIFSFSPSMGLGLGAGYYGASRSETLEYMAVGVNELVADYSVTAIPIFLNFHYFLPVGPKMKIDLFAGPVLALGTFKWYNTDAWLLWDLEYDFKSTGMAIGAQAGLGLDFQIAPKIGLILDVLYRFAPWNDLKGTLTEKGWLLIWNVDEVFDEAYLWSYQETLGGKTYDRVGISPEAPNNTAKHSPFQLGGLAVTAGIKIGLN